MRSRNVQEASEGASEKGFSQTAIGFLEGEPEVQTSLLAAVLEATAHPEPTRFIIIGLPGNQWNNLFPRLHPDWLAESHVFEAVIYDKQLA